MPRPKGITLDGRLVKRERTLRAWDQADLALQAGLTSRTISAAERGRPVSLNTVRCISRALALPPQRLTGTEE